MRLADPISFEIKLLRNNSQKSNLPFVRSKMHIMKLECSGQLPIGMFAEMERLGTNLNEIDTSDCENSLESLKSIAARLYANKDSLISSGPAVMAAAVAAAAINNGNV